MRRCPAIVSAISSGGGKKVLEPRWPGSRGQRRGAAKWATAGRVAGASQVANAGSARQLIGPGLGSGTARGDRVHKRARPPHNGQSPAPAET
jgi:hypothetical protein